MTELTLLLDRLNSASNYADFFGATATEDQVRESYKKLAKATHPYLHPNDADLATEVFRRLQELFTAALKAFEDGTYDKVPTLKLRSKRMAHEIIFDEKAYWDGFH